MIDKRRQSVESILKEHLSYLPSKLLILRELSSISVDQLDYEQEESLSKILDSYNKITLLVFDEKSKALDFDQDSEKKFQENVENF